MKLQLVPSDALNEGVEPIIVDYEDVKCSEFINNMVENAIPEDEEEEETKDSEIIDIPLPAVRHEILLHVVEFCKMYREEAMTKPPRPIPWPKRVYELVQHQYAAYVYTRTYALLYEIIHAANYMDILPLLELCLLRIARTFVNKTPEMMQTAFGIQQPFTEEEKKVILEEGRWTTTHTPPDKMESEPADVIREVLGVELAV